MFLACHGRRKRRPSELGVAVQQIPQSAIRVSHCHLSFVI
jgi:hypothetical protein